VGAGDRRCVEFLQWALPRMGLRWKGFRKVRRQVCRRVRRRLDALGLADLDTYRAHIEAHPGEWAVLDGLTAITISRFARDRGVFEALAREVLPALAADRDRLRAWSAGCASGEEPYTLALLAAERLAGVQLDILATDVDANVLRRAEDAAYGWGSVKELPEEWRARGFVRRDGLYVLRPEYRQAVTLRRHDVREPPPEGPYDLVLCRNLAFTYHAREGQRMVLAHVAHAMRPGGALVIGAHESLPGDGDGWFRPWPGARCVYRRSGAAAMAHGQGSVTGDSRGYSHGHGTAAAMGALAAEIRAR
jgi:chemotaxis protein methyltransferase CheR